MSNDPKKPTPQQLLAALVLSWGADTALRESGWMDTVPSLGQCVPTALVVQDYFGGEIWRAPLPNYRGSHYWNVNTKHAALDLTGGQFIFLNAIPEFDKGKRRTRKELLKNPDVQRRYIILSARVWVWLRWLC